MPPRGGTAWTSDRIRPPPHKPSAHQTPSKSDKGKGRAATPEPPRSAAVRKLDELLTGLRSFSSSSEPTQSQRLIAASEGCFCQARAHELSEYTPLCSTCGLVLCALHAPHRPCPHCAALLLDTAARNALIALLDEQRTHTLEEEGAARARAAQELRLTQGAFPALGGAPAAAAIAHGKGAGARVLSLSVDALTKTERVRVESYRSTNAREEVVVVVDEDGGGVPPRVSPPPREVQYIYAPRERATRWAVSKDGKGGAKYVAPPPAPRVQSDHAAGRRGKGKARDGAS